MLALPGGLPLAAPGTGFARRGPARQVLGSDVGTLRTHRTRSRWLPGADSWSGNIPFIRVRRVRHLVADAAGMGVTAEKQRADAGSTLSFFDLHSDYVGERNEFEATSTGWRRARRCADIPASRRGLVCALNAAERPLALPAGEPILASAAAHVATQCRGLAGVAAFRACPTYSAYASKSGHRLVRWIVRTQEVITFVDSEVNHIHNPARRSGVACLERERRRDSAAPGNHHLDTRRTGRNID